MVTRFCFSSLFLMFFTSLFGQGTVYVVSNTLDEGEGSFRQAVNNAENPGADTIVFEIPTTDPGFSSTSGVWSIEAATTYQIPEGTAIYGAIASGTEADPRPGIEIHGTDSSITLGLIGIRVASDVTLRNLIVNRFQYGIWVQASNVIIENCYVGTDRNGNTASPNGSNGILLANGASNNLIQNNLIAGNESSGIRLFGEETTNNTIIANLIGTNRQGTEGLANEGSGIRLHVGAHGNFIVENLISGNAQYGLWLTDTSTSNNMIQSNLIGTDISGTSAIPNGFFGVAFFNGPSNNIFGPGNRVAFNTSDGVLVDGADLTATVGNRITLNSISDNEGMGISNLRGGNVELSAPTIDSIVSNIVYGSAMSGYIVELFFDAKDEGCCFAGSDTVEITGNFQITLPDSFPDVPFLTATATDPSGNTSEFSEPFCLESPQYLFDGAAFCEGMNLHLSAGVYESYQWSTGATTEVITITMPGVYKVTVTDSRGCIGSDSVLVVEYPPPSVNIDLMETECANTRLDAGNFDSYLWSTGDSTPIITVSSSGTYSVMVTDSNGCTGYDSIFVQDDPLDLPWVKNLINNPFNPYCNECLTLSQASWMETSVILFDWDAGSCNFTDMGFTTIYNCAGDTIQHCSTSIAGVHCDPDAMIGVEDLKDEKLLWQCSPMILPVCPAGPEAILALPWVIDTLTNYQELCDVICIEGNAGNFLYRHLVDTNVILELRTTCAEIIRRFYDCQGNSLYSCAAFNQSGTSDCDLDFLPSLDAGELIWECPSTTGTSELSKQDFFKIFPTVFFNYLTIETEIKGPWKVTFYDGYGHVLDRKVGQTPSEIMNVSTWPSGIIYAKIVSRRNTQLVKLLKIE